METLSGKDILKHLPFRDVALRPQEAKKLLSDKVTRALNNNFDKAVSAQDDNPFKVEAIVLLEDMRSQCLTNIKNGGYSATAKEIDVIYNNYGKKSFEDITSLFIGKIFPKFFEDPGLERNPANICVGYLLDLINMVDEKKVNYDDRVNSIISAMRKNNFSSYDFGFWIDDAEHLRGTAGLPGEFFFG